MQMEEIKTTEYAWDAWYKTLLSDSYSHFLEGMRNKQLLGTICPGCNGLHVPARRFCEKCMVEMNEWVETDGEATIVSYTVCYVKFIGLPDPPSITGIIKIGNSLTNLVHRISGIDYERPADLEQKLAVGMKLRPVWRQERCGDILDIEYFEPVPD